jgi:hypothetical protein
MEVAGAFRYQPAFRLNEETEQELLNFEDISEIVDDSEICQTIVDYEFEEVDNQVIYGEIGTEDKTAKFFIRSNFNENSSPEEVNIYVPQDQHTYPNGREFWKGFNDRESEVAEKTEKVEEIAESFKEGNLVVINPADLIEEQNDG